ncbi:Transcription factor tau subunit sfc6 isoform 2 [Schistosoma japonicum]|uniref:Transcription factor tau subunit sfc6 isoform 2 n=1 Tax=Schistosoma japonicum TaxID=6182 RepID=A0A4Z2D601_SCHJA|nr:Transcription factor tau subunit sfc6 isoform 2 [Schistosoma japonicum]
MTATSKPRRASAKACLKAIRGLTVHQNSDDSSISENIESEMSDFIVENENNIGTTEESNSGSANEAETSSNSKISSISSPLSSVVDEPLKKSPNKAQPSILSDKGYLRSPFVRYMRSCRGRIDRDPRSIAPAKFQQGIDTLKHIFNDIRNPFLYCPSGYKSQFICRKKALFPTSGAWMRSPIYMKKDHLPEPPISPIYLCDERNPIKLKQFEYDKGSSLVYAGGAVTCLSWCPPRLYSLLNSESILNECSFLATACILTPGSQTLYSDNMTSLPGIIQIWNCGVLGLTEVSSTLNPEIHFIVSHEWGRITDMCWIPVSPFSGINELIEKACSYGSCMITIPEVDRVLGHLIVACQDGFVRIFSIPTCPMNFGFENSSASKFTYTLSKNCYLTLSPSIKENPHWLGWPTCVHIRCEFPDHLFVGYTTGYVCYYNVSSLNELVYSPQYNHLAPVKMSRLSNSPITTLSLHPLNGKMLYVQGLERVSGIWDLNDSLCFTSDSGEMIWNPAHGFMGREGMWINNGEFLVSSRDTWFTSTACRNNSFAKWSSLFNTMDNCISQFLPAEPNDGCSHLIPLGIQSLTSVDFSDSLNALVCSTDRGRIEVIAESMEKRRCDPSRPKYIPEMRIPVCQWTMEKRPSDKVTQSVLKTDEKLEESGDLAKFDYDIVDINGFMDECKIDPFPTNITSTNTAKIITTATITNTNTNTTTTNSIADFSSEMDSKELDDEKFRLSLFPSPNCEHCKLDHSMCWHKLWSNYQLRILLKDEVPMKPSLDFINTPMLKINKVRF